MKKGQITQVGVFGEELAVVGYLKDLSFKCFCTSTRDIVEGDAKTRLNFSTLHLFFFCIANRKVGRGNVTLFRKRYYCRGVMSNFEAYIF